MSSFTYLCLFVFKGTHAKPTYVRDAPPGTAIRMRKESGYISSELFMDFLRDHFIPRKPAGKNLLILDGHASHLSNPDMLELARDNDIIMLCLPSHTTHYLQPLDRVVFKPFRTYWNQACEDLIKIGGGAVKINRDKYGYLLNKAWSRTAISSLGVKSFEATGIYPYEPSKIPDCAYLLACDQDEEPIEPSPERRHESQIEIPLETPPAPSPTRDEPVTPSREDILEQSNHDGLEIPEQRSVPSTSSGNEILTPRSALKHISPIPRTLQPSLKKKRKQSATNLTETDFISKKKTTQSKRSH